MDRFTDTMLGKSGLLAMVGKAERGPETVASIAKHRSAYLIAVGAAAFLVSNAIRGSRIVAFPCTRLGPRSEPPSNPVGSLD